MKATPLEIPDVVLIESNVVGDEWSLFVESFNQSKLKEAIGKPVRFVHDNHSRCLKNVLRGLDCQIRQPQGKLMRVAQGEDFDAAVGLRKSSRTSDQWVEKILSSENKRPVWITDGFAHGFLEHSDMSDGPYKASNYYAPVSERSTLWNDEDINMGWSGGIQPIVSMKDAQNKPLIESQVIA